MKLKPTVFGTGLLLSKIGDVATEFNAVKDSPWLEGGRQAGDA